MSFKHSQLRFFIGAVSAGILYATCIYASEIPLPLSAKCAQLLLPPDFRTGGIEVTEAVREQIRKQVLLSFEQKFWRVSSDLSRTSRDNLLSLESVLRSKIGSEEFERLSSSAETVLSAVKKNVVVQSETGPDEAISILNSGNFLSLEEMIRQRAAYLEKKTYASTRFDIDGVIGQQDTVYLAIKANDLPPGKSGMDYQFGPVKFVFSKKVIDRGYLSVYPFDNSPLEFGLLDAAEKAPDDRIDRAVALYRKFIFSGVRDYEQLLKLSVVQSLWEQENKKAILGSLLRARQEVLTQVGDDASRKYRSFPGSEVCGVFKLLGQGCPSEISISTLKLLERNQGARISGDFGEGMKVLGAYSGFPISNGEVGVSLAHMWGFWELKIPRRLQLKELSSIRIQRQVASGALPITAEKIHSIIEKAKNYAASVGRTVRETREYDEAAITSDVSLGRSVNRQDYEVIWLEFSP